MKVAILSCNTGGGHNTAAASLAEVLAQRGHSCCICNALEFMPKTTAQVISKGHNFAYRHTPKLFGMGYRFEEKYQPSLFMEQSIKAALPLYHELQRQKADAVLCVHLFPAMMMTELRQNHGVTLPTWFISTDFTCYPGVSDLDVDGICMPHQELRQSFTDAGIPSHLLYATGIPVRQAFSQPMSRETARQTLDMPGKNRVLVLACGSMGAGPVREVAHTIAGLLHKEDLLVTICGNNQRLKQQMDADFWHNQEQVRVVGFTKQMDLYMHAADLLITKAGGLTTAEALAAQVPLLYLDAVPGCETYNLDFMVNHGCALMSHDEKDISPLLMGILSGAIDPQTMVQRRTSFPHHSAETICDLLCKA